MPTKAISKSDVIGIFDDFVEFAAKTAARTETKLDDTIIAGLKSIRDSEVIFNWLLALIGVDAPDGVFSVTAIPESVKLEFIGRGIGDGIRDRIIDMILPILVAAIKKWLAGQGIPLPSTEAVAKERLDSGVLRETHKS